MESLVHYSNPSHALSVLGALNEQRLRGQLCDTVLVVGDQRYQAHRSILASSSEYFQSLYSQRASEPHSVVQLDFCEPDAFEIVLNYIYSSSLFVDKGSLAAIQELGYSLGIPFLTNIMSAKPHVSYCVSRKKLSFTEEDRHDCQTKSVIVCQNRDNTPVPSRLNYREKTSEKSSTAPHSVTEQRQSLSHESVRTSESNVRKAIEITDKSDSKTNHPYTSILKGKSTHTTSMRPQLTTSVSFSDAEIQHTRLPSDLCMKEEDEESFNSPKTNSQKKAGEPSHAIDRSGPLIKSLLRRSLSMDSPVPVFSPALELKQLQNREQSVVHLMAETPGPVHSNLEHSSKGVPPLILRSKYQNRPYDKEPTQVDVVNVKAEPSSPLADPSDIIRITVGDSLPVNLKDFQMNYDQGPRTILHLSGKRKVRADNRRYPFKKFKVLPPADDVPQSASQIPDIDNRGKDLEEPRQCKVFKCWNCLKVFRSNAGLHRHVNMYHNPEKPYACEICHKRFHTNFKVWTHCQTQHGVVQNPASSSTSSVLDEKFQRKLIDIVREREIKKALLWKLKRNKQGLQSHSSAKKRSRTSFMCPYCGKVFLFESQFKRHLKTHPAKRTEQDAETEDLLYHKPEQLTPERENTDTEVFSCRLCNVKLSSLFEQGDHERGCRHATVCPYCGLRFSSPSVKKDHEAHCKFKKLTCLECMRTFKSSFSIWRHQVEVHNHNIMTVKEQMSLDCQENNGAVSELLTKRPDSHEPDGAGSSREDIVYSDSSGPPMFDSEDSSSFVPEDLSMGQHHGNLVVKEEPMEEAVCDGESIESATAGLEEPGVWPCEKCSKLFGCHKDLERHQELLCHIKPFICHICNKAFRTNFRLWSHFQSHMSTSDEVGAREVDRRPSSPSPSPPLTPHVSGHPVPQASPPKTSQTGSTAEEEPHSVAVAKTKISEVNRQDSSHSPLSRTDSVENPPQESDTLFYHAPTLSALTFKRQYMCKLCHRTFKTAFSLWSHEQSHSQL